DFVWTLALVRAARLHRDERLHLSKQTCHGCSGRTKPPPSGRELQLLQKPRGPLPGRESAPVRHCPWGKSSARREFAPAETLCHCCAPGSKRQQPVRMHAACAIVTLERT